MQSGFLTPETFAISIPLISILGGVAIAIVAIIMGARKKELQHKERLMAMEKGIELPELPTEKKRPAYLTNRSSGLVMTALGVALTIALLTVAGPVGGVWGLIPLGIGIGLIVSANMEKREVERERDRNSRGGGV